MRRATMTSADAAEHAILPRPSHDEAAREAFVRTLKSLISAELTPAIGAVWERRATSDLIHDLGREPRSRHEVRLVMMRDPYVQRWSALRRMVQEQLWDTVVETVERQLDELTTEAEGRKVSSGGTLELNPKLSVPIYLRYVDIHCMPTGYYAETRPADMAAGAIYDRGVHVYTLGQLGPLNDDLGRTIVENYLAHSRPSFRPARILDMGCSVGHSTLPYVDAYPEAEVHGIDVAAPMLRYAHRRAGALGKKVHFAQKNAERTQFDDESFELIVSHILMHETSWRSLRRIFEESFRLLAPGGLMIHGEFPQYEGVDLFTQFMLDWDTYNNNEPFWGAMHDTDLVLLCREAGFTEHKIWQERVPTGRQLQSGRRQAGELALIVAEK